jgi:arylsulfatase A-like enzyme
VTDPDTAGADRPNVVWIVLEDTTPRLGCYGDALARTPRLDDLAAEGRRYENAFCPAAVCAPSRAAVMTGMAPPTLGAHHMRTATHDREGLPDSYQAVPPHYVTAVPEYFRDAGYYCTLDVKTDYQFGDPFTLWDHHGDGAGWWDGARAADQPFFAAFTNGVTHESGMWDPGAPDQFGGAVAEPTTDPDDVDVPPYLVDAAPTRRAIARQYDNLERADRWVGDLLDRLAANGHAHETIVVVWSDHGEGLPRRKRWPYDDGTRVPLLVRWPAVVEGGSVESGLVSLVDLGPAMLSACGLPVPRYVEGRPFLAPDDTARPDREYVFATRDRYDESYDMVRSVRDDRFRYVRHYYPERPYVQWVPYRNRHPAMQDLLERRADGDLTAIQARWFADTRPAEELYDLRDDPHEVDNVADDPAYRTVLDRFRGALDDWRDRTGDVVAGREAESQLRERGWPGGDRPTTAVPTFVPNAPGNRDREPTPDGGTFDGPITLRLFCATQGASIGYTTEAAPDAHWKLYGGPIRLTAGDRVTVRARAVRYGYAESPERAATFAVE